MDKKQFVDMQGNIVQLGADDKPVREADVEGLSIEQAKSTANLGINVLRALAQGATFGFADELEALGFALYGADYDKALERAREGLDTLPTAVRLPAEIVGSLPYGIAGAGLKALGKAGLYGAAYGAGAADDGDRISSAIGGGVLGAGLQKFSPQITDEARKLLKKGVPLTIGQSLGGTAKMTEEAIAGIPIMGGVVKAAQRDAAEGFNRQVFNEALAPIGEKISAGKVGSDAFEEAISKISKRYDDIIPNVGVEIAESGEQIANRLSNQISPLMLPELKRILARELDQRVVNGRLSGEAFKKAQSAIRTKAYKMSRSSDAFQQELGEALSAVSFEITASLKNVSPELAGKLAKTDTAYSRLVPLQSAAIKGEAREGVFTPAQLQQAIKQDEGMTSRLAKGQAPLQELARAGRATVGEQLGDSGTATRNFVTNLLMGGGAGATVGMPTTGAIVGGGLSALYTSPMQSALRTSLPAIGRVGRSPAIAGLLGQETPRLDITLDDLSEQRQRSILGQ